MDFEYISGSTKQTIRYGRKLGSMLKGGEVLGVSGTLGSGKTHLIKGIAQGAGAKNAGHKVNSPTFCLINEYKGRFDIYHIDAYRLNSLKEFEMLGFDDLCYPHSVVLIEWADKIKQALQGINYIRIHLFFTGAHKRKIVLQSAPEYIRL